jgi:polysaccharide export outer membrane protein
MHNTGHEIRSRRKALLFPAAIVWLMAAALTPLFAQNPPPAVVPAAPAAQLSGDFAIGISDLLSIDVLGVPDFTRELRVSARGTIRLPFLGEIKVDGLTPAQAEVKLASLLDPDYVIDPQVSVIVKEPRSRMFSILGAVLKPGQFQMLEPITLMSAIAGAGGLDLTKAGDKASIQRTYPIKSSDSPAATSMVTEGADAPDTGSQIEVDLKKLMLDGDRSLDLPILPGDVINIRTREPNSFFVVGDVNRPGPFEFPLSQKMKLSRALAMAGGPTKTSKLKDTALIRQHPDGSVDRVSLNLDKVLKGKADDVDLQPNDLVYIPGSVEKSLGWAMLSNNPLHADLAVIALIRNQSRISNLKS